MFKRFFAGMDRMFKDLDDDLSDLTKEITNGQELGPLPDGVTETKTTEIETKPDGTVIKRTVIRRATK